MKLYVQVIFVSAHEAACQSAKLCNTQSCGGCQQCLFLSLLPAAGHLCGPWEPAGHVPSHLRTAATLRGVLLQASSVRQDGNQTRGQCQIQPGRGWRLGLSNSSVFICYFFFFFNVCFIKMLVDAHCYSSSFSPRVILNQIIHFLLCSWSNPLLLLLLPPTVWVL